MIAKTIKFTTVLAAGFAVATIGAGTANAASGDKENTRPVHSELRDATQGIKRSAEVRTPLGGILITMNITQDGNKAVPGDRDWSQLCGTRGGAGNVPAHCK